MAKKKKSNKLPKLEILIILVFFMSFIIWAMSQCNASALDALPKALSGEEVPAEETIAEQTGQEIVPVVTAVEQTTVAAQGTAIRERYTPLYVTIDELKLRRGPHLDSTIILALPLYQELIFLNEITSFNQKINLGEETVDEPWIKVKHPRGRVGWVYGAGVHYFKKKRIIIEEPVILDNEN